MPFFHKGTQISMIVHMGTEVTADGDTPAEPTAPQNIAQPVTSPAAADVPATVMTTNGSWIANPAPTFTFQWYLDDVAIPGATDSDVYSTDPGELSCDVTATNSEGSETVRSTISTLTEDSPAPPSDDFTISHHALMVGSGGATSAHTHDQTKAFVLANNVNRSGAGLDDGGTLDSPPIETSVIARLGSSTITLERENSASQGSYWSGSVLEYIGEDGGDNEFIVRDKRTVTLTDTQGSFSVPGIVNNDDVAVFITGLTSTRGNNSGYDHACPCAWFGGGTVFYEGRGPASDSGGGTLKIEITTVEMTGANWTVHHGQRQIDDDNGFVILGSNVGDWNHAWINGCFSRDGNGRGGIADIACQYEPGSSANLVDYAFDDAHQPGSGRIRHSVFVLENPNMTVTRFSGNVAANDGNIDISSVGLEDPSKGLLEIRGTMGNTGSDHNRSQRSVEFVDKDTVRYFAQSAGTNWNYHLQVIELPNVGDGSGDPGAMPETPSFDDADFTVTNLSSGANIQSTINGFASLAGRKIKLAAGTYDGFEVDHANQGEGTLENPFVIEGPDVGEARILPRSNADSILINGADYVHLNQLYIEGATNDSFAGLSIKYKGNTGKEPRGNMLLRSTVARRDGDGVKYSQVFDQLVDRVIFSDDIQTSSPGERHLDFNKFENATIRRCDFHQHRAMNAKGGSRTLLLEACNFYNCISTVEIGEWEGSGYWDHFDGVRDWSVQYATVRNNGFTGSANYDIRFKDTHDAVITANFQHSTGSGGTDAVYDWTNGTTSGNSSYRNERHNLDGVDIPLPT